MRLNSLTGRLLLLTILFVMLAEVFIFVPSVARFRENYLTDRLERSQIAALARLNVDQIDDGLEAELLANAGVLNVVLRRDESRALALSEPFEGQIAETYDLRNATAWELIADAIGRLIDPRPRIVRVIGNTTQDAGLYIEVVLRTSALREAMIEYGLRILALSAVISGLTASLLFVVVRRFLVRPIKRVVDAMESYADHPEDARRVITPSAGILELRQAEDALRALQTEMTSLLRQKDRLAQLGGAVAKISHDLRNILSAAQLFADRLDTSKDPAVRRLSPKLVAAISRAIHLCEATLAFGRAEEPPPTLDRVSLPAIVEDMIESERLAAGPSTVTFVDAVPAGLILRADPEQIHRLLTNLARNARQAIESAGRDGEVRITAGETERHWWVSVADDGPGLPPKAREHLFTPFTGGTRKGGTGLGLAIAAELARGHGGRLDLTRTSEEGTVFTLYLPRGTAQIDVAA